MNVCEQEAALTRPSQLAVILRLTLVLFALALGNQARAQQQQQGVVNPTASVQTEHQLLDTLGRIQGRGSIPDVRSYVIEQPAGREWRLFHDIFLRWIGGAAMLGIVGLLTAFYLWRGTIRYKGGRSGRKILRFTAFERFVHWMTTVSFIILAVSGLNITFGKILLLPLMKPAAFSAWSEAAKHAHNYLSFPFTIGVGLMLLMWIGQNFPTRVDIEWIKHGGGMFGGEEPAAGKFNAGEKLIFWIVVIGGGILATAGYMLLFPFYGTGIATMQLAQIVHSTAGVLYIAAIIVHIYMGSLGTKGAFEGMASGNVDVNWAMSHHSLWYEEQIRDPGLLSHSSNLGSIPATVQSREIECQAG
jgi:formate dehydrogenase subunit gamma